MKKKIGLKTVRKILVWVLVVVVCLGIGFWFGERRSQLENVKSFGSAWQLVANKDANPQNVDFGEFWDVWQRLEKSYLEQKDFNAKKMVDGAIMGMVQALGDPYTTYLPPAENKQTQEDLNGQFAGVGIQLGYIKQMLAVMSPLPGQPAAEAGIKAGDLILHIKDVKKNLDKDTDGMSLPEAVQDIRGNKGDAITLTIFRDGDKQTKEIALVRDTIVVPSVAVKFVDKDGKEDTKNGRYAWLIVSKFGDKTMDEWEKAVTEILADKNIKGIVLDLRNNPGGFLQRAIDLASEFIPSGVVVAQQGKVETETFSVNHVGRLIGHKLVVLVNKGSASASEILAGALREDLGVKLVGDNTFGKGTVQEAQELPAGAGLHVTIAKWLLPKGTNIHKVGLKPDIEVKESTDSASIKDDQLIRAIEELSK